MKQVYLKPTVFHEEKTEHIYRTRFEREENSSDTFAGSSAQTEFCDAVVDLDPFFRDNPEKTMPIFDHSQLKSTAVTFSFPKVVCTYKK